MTSLINAVKRKDFTRVEQLVDQGIDVNAQTKHGTALQTAIMSQDFQIVKLLVDSGADVNAQTEQGTALQTAVKKQDFEIVTFLVDNGADVNAQTEHSTTLEIAAALQDFQIIKFLVNNGADVNTQTEHGTALQAAVRRQDLEVVKFLIDNGANVNAQTKYSTALQAAIAFQDFQIVKILVDNGADVNTQTKYGTVLQEAIAFRDFQIVKILVDSGADVNAQLEHRTALQAAIAFQNLEITKFLVDKGADVNCQGGLYGTALQEAVKKQDLEIVKCLVDNGADVCLKGLFHQTALHYAAGHESATAIAIVELLLYKNACPNVRDDADKTPFDVAIEARSREIILLLLPRMKPVPALSAKCWRSALHLGPESFPRFTFGQDLFIKEIDTRRGEMQQEAIQIQFQRKKGLSKPSTPEDVTHVVLNSKMWKINSSSIFKCQWWRYGPITNSEWSLPSSPLPSLDLCRQLEREDFFIECWFTIPCLTFTDNNWPAPQVSMPEKYDLLERTEGFYWITTRWPSENSTGDSPTEELLRPVVSVTTCEDSPVEIVQSIGDLLIPLIDKLDRTFEDNTHQANSRLSYSRREVLRNGGNNEGLTQNLLSDATVIEYMTENYGRIVRSLTELIDRVNSLQKGPWTLSDKSLQDSRKKVENLKRHREALRELLEKSQGIIQLEFNLASIMEARKSTSTNRSLKRLTWVTFVFLPLLFVASLFGMNVDILSDDPSWWWYFPVAGGFTLLTFVVWIFFKRFRTLEGSLERYFAWLVGDNSAGVKQSMEREEENRDGGEQMDVKHSTGILGKLRKRKRKWFDLESGNGADT